MTDPLDFKQLTDLVHRIWYEDMAPKERTALKQEIAQSLGLPHAHVVGLIDFDDEVEKPSQVARRLQQLAGDLGGSCGM